VASYPEKAIIYLLEQDATFGGLAGDYIYAFGGVPDNTPNPYAVVQRISRPRVHAMGSDPGLCSPRFQVSAWSNASYDEARKVADAVIGAIQDYSGTAKSTTIHRIFFEGDRDDYDPDTKEHGVLMDFIVWHDE